MKGHICKGMYCVKEYESICSNMDGMYVRSN